MIDYPHFRRQQIPIGSGNVESGHKVVMQKRMKQAGMRWAEESINPMLALRVALCNQTWNTSWREIEMRVRQEKYLVSAGQNQDIAQATEPRIVTDEDCQRLTALAERIGRKKRQQWQNNNWIFPYRQNSIHKN